MRLVIEKMRLVRPTVPGDERDSGAVSGIDEADRRGRWGQSCPDTAD